MKEQQFKMKAIKCKDGKYEFIWGLGKQFKEMFQRHKDDRFDYMDDEGEYLITTGMEDGIIEVISGPDTLRVKHD